MSEVEIGAGDLRGRVIDRRFEIEDKLGEGGMGTIYRAKQLSMTRMVALKLLLRDRRGDPISAERFKHEAYLASRLRHPNAVVIYDFGQSDDGLLYIAMELLAGRNLKEALSGEAPFEYERAIKIMYQTLRPIAQAHGMGLVHRDLKPANIFLTEVEGDKDFVKVLDFGVAKLTAVQEATEGYQGGLTVAGKIYGTPNYMSPEQIRGKDVDQHSDLYSLGIIFYEMLTGKRPFEAETPVDVMMMHLRDDPVPPSKVNPSLPIELDDVALKALAKEPNDRFDTAEAFIEALTAVHSRLGGFGNLGGERFSSSSSMPALTPAAPKAEEFEITGLGFDDGDFDEGYQDENTVLENNDSELEFSVSLSDIEGESLDGGEQDTVFQSAANDSIQALFDDIDKSNVSGGDSDGGDPSQLEALGVDGDEFGVDEPSTLMPIIQKEKPVFGHGSGKQTMVGYVANAPVPTPQKSPFGQSSVPPSAFGAVPPPAEKINKPEPSAQVAQPKQAEVRPAAIQKPKTVEPLVPESAKESPWGQQPQSEITGQRFAIPSTPTSSSKKNKVLLWVVLLFLLLGGGGAAFFFLSQGSQPKATLTLFDASSLKDKVSVFVDGEVFSGGSVIRFEEGDLSRKDVLLQPSGGVPLEFKLPSIVKTTSLAIFVEDESEEFGSFTVRGSAPEGQALTISGRSVSTEVLIVIAPKGKKLKLLRGGKSREIEVPEGMGFQQLDF